METLNRNNEELLAFLGLLTISMGLIKMSRHRSLLEYQRLVPEAHQFFDQFLLKTGYLCPTPLCIFHKMKETAVF